MRTPFMVPAIIALMLFAGCIRNESKTVDTETLNKLKRTMNDKRQPLPLRVAAAVRGDTLAALLYNKDSSIEFTNNAASLYYELDSIGKALFFFRRTIQLASASGNTEYAAIGYNNLGLILGEKSVYDSALICYGYANDIFLRQKDYKRLAQGLINAGIVYKNIGSYDTAFAKTLEAIRLMERFNTPAERASAYTTMGNILKELNRSGEALVYHQKALKLREELGDKAGAAAALNNIGNVYKHTGAYKVALDYYLQSLAEKKRAGVTKTITVTDNIADVYLQLGRYDLARVYTLKALEQRKGIDDVVGLATSLNRLSRLYLAGHNTDSAMAIALQIGQLLPSSGLLKERLEQAQLLQRIHHEKQDYRQAEALAVQAQVLKDSLFSENMANAISAMNISYHVGEQEKELETASRLNTVYKKQSDLQLYFIVFLTIAIGLLLIVIYQLYRSNIFRKRSKEYVELLMTELNHRVKNNMQIVIGILQFQELTAQNSRELELIDKIRNRISLMGGIHELLHEKTYTGGVDTRPFITALVKHLEHFFQDSSCLFEISVEADDFPLPVDRLIPLGIVLNELLTNIYKYAGTSKDLVRIYVRLSKDKGQCLLIIKDEGAPWDSGKMQPGNQGLGLFLIETLLQQLGASHAYEHDGTCNCNTIIFPVAGKKATVSEPADSRSVKYAHL